MRFDIITIFPNIFEPLINESIIKRARNKKKVTIKIHDLRKYTKDKHKKVDDKPYGGGPGMVLSAQPIFDCLKKVKGKRKARVILMCPTGKPFVQKKAKSLAKENNIIIICGHYEGVDERVRKKLVNESISIGDYVLTGGEIPAMVLVDSITRLIPGVLGSSESLINESFEKNLLEHSQYTRPSNFRGLKVPKELLSGDHQKIKEWQKKSAIDKTNRVRGDLLTG